MNRRTELSVIVILCLITIFPLSASSKQKLWSSDSELVSQMQILYSVCGFARAGHNGNVTTGELMYSLDYLKKECEQLSSDQLLLFEDIEDKLKVRPDLVFSDDSSMDISLIYSFELYAHTNEQQVREEQLWHLQWPDRLPLISVPLTFSLFDTFYSSVDFVVTRRLLDYPDQSIYSSSVSTNHSLRDFFTLDLNWPYRAVAAAGGGQWNFQFGRAVLNMGPAYTGNLLISDDLPYHDYAQFRTWFGPLTFTAQGIGFPPPSETGEGDDTIKMLLTHRVDWNVTSSIRLSVTEAMMYQDTILEPRFLNPMMIYHQYFMSDKSNSFLTAEMIVSLIPGLTIYGQAGVDEMQILGESSSIPNALGWQAGIEYAWLNKGSMAHIWAEFVHTDPYLYLRDGINYTVAFKNTQTYFTRYVGYPLGGDAEVLALGFEWDNSKNMKVFGSVQYSRKGEVYIRFFISSRRFVCYDTDRCHSDDGKAFSGDEVCDYPFLCRRNHTERGVFLSPH